MIRFFCENLHGVVVLIYCFHIFCNLRRNVRGNCHLDGDLKVWVFKRLLYFYFFHWVLLQIKCHVSYFLVNRYCQLATIIFKWWIFNWGYNNSNKSKTYATCTEQKEHKLKHIQMIRKKSFDRSILFLIRLTIDPNTYPYISFQRIEWRW